jgi:regulator of sigma E protease
MDAVLFAIVTLVPLLLILVVVHELGHFATARVFGVKVLEFGVGFPPRAFGIYTGRTPVMLHPQTRFVGLDGPQELRPGQLVKVGSLEDEECGLVAFEVELHRKQDEDESESNFNHPVDNLLWHEGKVRSVGDGSFELADMLYSVNVIPLGGFVRLAGESNPTVPLSLASRRPWERIVVLAAGSLMNALLPLVIFAIVFMLPQEVEVGRLTTTSVAPGSAAAEAGLQPGDVFVEANGKPVKNRIDFTREINLNGGSEMTVLIERDDRQEAVALRPRFDADGSRWLAGVRVELADARVERRSRPIWEAVPESFVRTWELLVLLRQSIGGMVSEGAAPELSGPIGIAQLTGEVSREGGFAGWLSVGILLSINLAIVNILPFPMLDGGRIVFVVIEWIRRGKRISPEKEGLIHLIGLAVIVAGIVAISANDILRLIEGGTFLGG